MPSVKLKTNMWPLFTFDALRLPAVLYFSTAFKNLDLGLTDFRSLKMEHFCTNVLNPPEIYFVYCRSV